MLYLCWVPHISILRCGKPQTQRNFFIRSETRGSGTGPLAGGETRRGNWERLTFLLLGIGATYEGLFDFIECNGDLDSVTIQNSFRHNGFLPGPIRT
jgi:hypothetical protein